MINENLVKFYVGKLISYSAIAICGLLIGKGVGVFSVYALMVMAFVFGLMLSYVGKEDAKNQKVRFNLFSYKERKIISKGLKGLAVASDEFSHKCFELGRDINYRPRKIVKRSSETTIWIEFYNSEDELLGVAHGGNIFIKKGGLFENLELNKVYNLKEIW